MTSVLIIGGGGMIGQKLALSYKNNETVSLLDMAFPESIDANAKKIHRIRLPQQSYEDRRQSENYFYRLIFVHQQHRLD